MYETSNEVSLNVSRIGFRSPGDHKQLAVYWRRVARCFSMLKHSVRMGKSENHSAHKRVDLGNRNVRTLLLLLCMSAYGGESRVQASRANERTVRAHVFVLVI